MKSNYYLHLMAATTMLCGLSACSDADLGGNGNGETVTFTAKLPMELTRAVGDGTNVKNLTCLVYDKKGNYVTQASASIQNAQANVTLQLASNVDYQLVFWAAAPNSPYTLTNNGMLNADLTHMNANDEANDAFYNKIDFIGGAEKTKTVTLHRPLAQINIGTDDSTLPVVNAAYPSGIYTTLTTDVYTTMDLLSGEVSGRTNITTPVAPISSLEDEKYPVNHTDANKKYKYTNVIYTLVPTQGAVSDMTFTSYASDAEGAPAMQSRPVTAVPMKQNFRTNIYGALLTSTTDFKVTINPAFTDGFYNDLSQKFIAEIFSKKDENGNVQMTITEDYGTNPIAIPDSDVPYTIEINLNGHTLPDVVVGENVTLRLLNDIVSEAAKSSRRTKSNYSVQSTTFTANPGSRIEFYGGEYQCTQGGKIIVNNGGTIVIYGGDFKGQDISEFVDPRCSVYTYQDSFGATWQCVSDAIAVANIDDFETAINTANKSSNTKILIVADLNATTHKSYRLTGDNTKIIIRNGITFSLTPAGKAHAQYSFVVAPGASLTFSGDGTFRDEHRLLKIEANDTEKGNVTIESGNFIGGRNYNNSLIWNNKGIMTINDVKIESLGYCVYNAGALTINDGEFINTSTAGIAQYAIYAEEVLNDNGDLVDMADSLIIKGGTFKAHEGVINIGACRHVEISGGDFFVIYGPADELYYSLYINYVEEGEISGGNFYAASDGNFASVYVDDNKDSAIRFTGGYYGGATRKVTPADGYSWQNINIASPVNGCTPLTKQIVRNPSSAKRR